MTNKFNKLYKNLLLKLSKQELNCINEQDTNNQDTNEQDISNLYKNVKNNRHKNEEDDKFCNYYILRETDDLLLQTILMFINNTSYRNIKTEYSQNFLQYLVKCNICMIFYDDVIKQDTILGVVFFKICDNISIKQYNTSDFTNNQKCLYINWMFLSNRLRGKNNIIKITEIIKKHYIRDINYIIYKTNRYINKTLLYEELYYYRPINIDKLIEQNMIKNEIDPIILKKIYNTFSYTPAFLKNYTIELITSCNHNYNLEELSNFITHELHKEYEVFENFIVNELIEIFDNDLFYKFIIRDQVTQEIQSFVCLYNVTFSKNDHTLFEQEKLINSVVCCIFVKDTKDTTEKSYTLEMISEYCYKNNICDMITITNFLNIKLQEYKNFKLINSKIDNIYYIEKVNGKIEQDLSIKNKVYKCFMKL